MRYVLGLSIVFLTMLFVPSVLGVSITHMNVHAPSLQAGDRITVTYTLEDHTSIGRVHTNVYLPGAINHRTTVTAHGTRFVYEEQFILPQAANPHDVLFLQVDVEGKRVFNRQFQLQPHQAPAGEHIPTQQPVSQPSHIQVLVDPVRDVIPGDSIYYRVQIRNHGDKGEYITVGLSDTSSWATWSVHPYPTLYVPSQSVREAFIYLRVDEQAPPGITFFSVNAYYANTYEEAEIRIAVLRPINPVREINWAPWILLGAVLVVLLVLGAAAYVFTRQRKKKDEGGEENDDEEFITYY